MGASDPFIERSRAATAVTLTIALAAFAAIIWYLRPGLPSTLINLTVAGLLLVGPLATRWPISPRRAAISAVLWFAVGIPGSYIFGVFVMYASLVLAVAIMAFVLAAELHSRISVSSD